VKLLRRFLLSLAVAGLLLWLLFEWGGIGPAELADSLRALEARTYWTALGVHLAIHWVRSLRYQVLIPPGQRPGALAMLACSSAHNLASYVLPAKTGEATLVVYLRSLTGLSAARGLASLLVSRLLDLAVLGAAMGAILLALRGRFPQAPWMASVGSAALLGGLALTGLALVPDRPARLLQSLLRRLGLESHPFGARLLAKAGEGIAALRLAAAGPRLALAWLLTAAIWALVFQFYAVLARGTGLPADLGYLEACLGSSLAVLFNLLPVNGFAGFGTQEAGWKIGFGLLGVPGDVALASGVAAHLVQLANVVLLGLLGHLWMGLARRTGGAPPAPADGSGPVGG
jgi:hypothetical protein